MWNKNDAIREEIINFLQDGETHTTKEIFCHIHEKFQDISERNFSAILHRFKCNDNRIKMIKKGKYSLSSIDQAKIEINYEKYAQTLKDKCENDIALLNQDPFEQYQSVEEWRSAAKIVELNKRIIDLIDYF